MKIYAARIRQLDSNADILDALIGKNVWVGLTTPWLPSYVTYIKIISKSVSNGLSYYDAYKFAVGKNEQLPMTMHNLNTVDDVLEVACGGAISHLEAGWTEFHLIKPLELLSDDDMFQFAD